MKDKSLIDFLKEHFINLTEQILRMEMIDKDKLELFGFMRGVSDLNEKYYKERIEEQN